MVYAVVTLLITTLPGSAVTLLKYIGLSIEELAVACLLVGLSCCDLAYA